VKKSTIDPESATPAYLRAERAAAFLDVSVATLWRYVDKKRLPRPKKLGRRITLFKVADLRRLVDRAPRSRGSCFPRRGDDRPAA
jgi:predicted DNA-binding transcriptional regulator AlpA